MVFVLSTDSRHNNIRSKNFWLALILSFVALFLSSLFGLSYASYLAFGISLVLFIQILGPIYFYFKYKLWINWGFVPYATRIIDKNNEYFALHVFVDIFLGVITLSILIFFFVLLLVSLF